MKLREDKEKIDRYIKLMYSQGSKLNHIQDLEERKMKAAKQAGWTDIDETITEIMQMKDATVNKKIFNFLCKNNSNRYVKLVSDQQLYWSMMQKNMELQGTDHQNLSAANKLSGECEDLLKRIESTYAELFLEKEVVMIAEKQVKAMTFEERMMAKKNKQVNLSDYQTDQMSAS